MKTGGLGSWICRETALCSNFIAVVCANYVCDGGDLARRNRCVDEQLVVRGCYSLFLKASVIGL